MQKVCLRIIWEFPKTRGTLFWGQNSHIGTLHGDPATAARWSKESLGFVLGFRV